MTLTKAIEILTLMGTPQFEGHTEDIIAARKLGIASLKRQILARSYNAPYAIQRLPGEDY